MPNKCVRCEQTKQYLFASTYVQTRSNGMSYFIRSKWKNSHQNKNNPHYHLSVARISPPYV